MICDAQMWTEVQWQQIINTLATQGLKSWIWVDLGNKEVGAQVRPSLEEF